MAYGKRGSPSSYGFRIFFQAMIHIVFCGRHWHTLLLEGSRWFELHFLRRSIERTLCARTGHSTCAGQGFRKSGNRTISIAGRAVPPAPGQNPDVPCTGMKFSAVCPVLSFHPAEPKSVMRSADFKPPWPEDVQQPNACYPYLQVKS